MNDKTRKATPQGRPASSPCLAAEIAPDWFDPLGVDPQQAIDVARWRKATRARLLAQRKAVSIEAARETGAALAAWLRAFLAGRIGAPRGCVLSGYWPIKAEPDLREVLVAWHDEGGIAALPLVETVAAPLVFRRWTPETRMVRGHWNIPVPPPEAEVLRPDICLAPLVGWDAEGYRLGYGGGYFDRTLAALRPRPLTIGIGTEAARLATIHPQPHDIGLDMIVTEAGIRHTRT